MKQPPSPHSYNDYRSYIKDALKAVGLTYQQFCNRNAKTVSFPALGQMLSNRSYRMGLEAYHRVLRALRLGEHDIAHLILLRLENDVAEDEKNATEVRAILKKLLEVNRSSASSGGGAVLSHDSLKVAEAFEILPDYLKERVIKEIISVFHVFKARHPKRATINHALNSLVAMQNSSRKDRR